MDAQALAAVERRVKTALRYFEQAFCITVVVGASPDDVLLAFGGDPAEPPVPVEVTWEKALPAVALVRLPHAVVAVEDNGYQGSREVVLRKASAGRRAASFFRNVNALTDLSLAMDGHVLFSQEVLWKPEVSDPALAPFFADLDWKIETCDACALTVVERFTGITIDKGGRPAPGLVHLLTPWLDEPPARSVVDGPDDPWLHSSDWPLGNQAFSEAAARYLTAAVRRSLPEAQRRLAAFAARSALRSVGMEDHPDVVATVATLETETPALAPETERLLRQAVNVGRSRDTPLEYNALKALQHACRPDSASAALSACWRAGYTFWCAEREAGPRAGQYLSDEEMSGRATGRAAPAFLREAYDVLGIPPPFDVV